jgi:hypothetical protein
MSVGLFWGKRNSGQNAWFISGRNQKERHAERSRGISRESLNDPK